MNTMTPVQTGTATLAQMLLKRQSLDAGLFGYATRREAAAEALQRAGSTLNPQNRSARSVLAALAKIEALAHLETDELQRLWLSLRALDLKPGETIGGSMADDPIVGVFAKANGVVPTLDLDERVAGIVGDLHGRAQETLSARARIVHPGGNGDSFELSTVDTVLFSEGVRQVSAEAILKAIDGVDTRHAAGPAQTSPSGKATGPQTIDYDIIEPQASSVVGDTLFEAYKPARLSIAGAQEHPTPLVESAALASVYPPAPSYRPYLKPEIITNGVLSAAQIETVIYAGQAHSEYLPSDPMDPNAPAPRQGILVGHGTGFGKGRSIAGIIADNWVQGRKRAVWIVERHRHVKNCTQDWIALGGRASDIIDLKAIAPGDQIPGRNGILVVTYSLLRGGDGKQGRVDQITNWLGLTCDGVIVFDESQNMRYAVVRESKSFRAANKTSQQGVAGISLQQTLPNARVVYASATSASDIATLGYGVRLGLWGKGTAFPTATAFFEQMEEGGINALELVARDLKARGLYLAANLSFDGVGYERLEYALTDEERQVQNTLSEAWAKVNVALTSALQTTGVATLAKNAGKAIQALRFAQFGMARSRFFQAYLASVKMKPVIAHIRADLANGHSAIIQMTNTFEANAERALAENTSGDLNDVEATPKDILVEYIRNQFPVQKYSVVRAGKKLIATPMYDKNGDPVTCPKAEAERDALIQDVQSIDMPEGPLEQLLAAFGPEMVAEVTGRRRRLVPGITTGTRVLEDRSPAQVDEDVRCFQTGAKRILVFSTSGAAGSNYHADRSCQNQSLRRHYLVQPGWRADLAIQGLGRSHRSNQVQPPVYILVTTDLWSDRRAISTVASGMQKLGAITRGQRHAASQELFTEDDNLESAMAQDAWVRFLKDLEANKVSGLTLIRFEHETGIPLREDGTRKLMTEVPPVRRFLNAMSGMTCEKQEVFGTEYKKRLDEVKLESIRNGSYDRGIETLTPESLIKLEDTIICRDPRSGAPTRLLKMLRIDPVTPVSYMDVQRNAIRSGNARFVKSALTNRIACLIFPRLAPSQPPSPDDKITVYSPTGMRQRPRREIVQERWALVGAEESQGLWEAELANPVGDEESIFYVVTGTLLPIWDRLPKKKVTVYRMETDEGERILGRTLPEEWVDKFVRTVNAAQGGGVDPMTALQALENGEFATLANGWAVEGRANLITGQSVIELLIIGDDPHQFRTELEADGLISQDEKLNKSVRFFLPANPMDREQAWKAITTHRPIVGLTSING